LVALVSPVQNIIFVIAHFFTLIAQQPPEQAVVPGRLSLTMCLLPGQAITSNLRLSIVCNKPGKKFSARKMLSSKRLNIFGNNFSISEVFQQHELNYECKWKNIF
jgi:hypothetical protein